MRLLVGGVGELLQGDLDVGRVVLERLRLEGLGADVLVEDISYGAVAVSQYLEDLAPDGLVVVGAVSRGRPPGTVGRRRVMPDELLSVDVANGAIRDAVTGYVGAELLIDVSGALGSRPAHTVLIDVEPLSAVPGDPLSDEVEGAVDDIVLAVREEVERMPLLGIS
ncbi:MAG: hypothetical protein KY395_04925 [Actinobacteria bacterium]|nr:hypothetical protein [Actinomycetota bacterium]